MPEFKWAPKLTRKIVSIWDFYWLHAKQASTYIQQNTDKKYLLLAFGRNSVCWNMDFVVVLGILCVLGVKFTPLPVNKPLFSTAWVLQAGNVVCLKWKERNGVPGRKIARICFESPNGSQNHMCLGTHWALQLVLVCLHTKPGDILFHFYLKIK